MTGRRIFILATLLVTGYTSDAQTKRIAHRSHSGSDARFEPQSRRTSDDLGIRMDHAAMESYRRRDSIAARTLADRAVADSARGVAPDGTLLPAKKPVQAKKKK